MRGANSVCRGFCEKFDDTGGEQKRKREVMSLRIAAALGPPSGSACWVGTQAQARPDWSVSGATIRPEHRDQDQERRLYLVVVRASHALFRVGVGRAGKQWAGHHPDRRQVSPSGMSRRAKAK